MKRIHLIRSIAIAAVMIGAFAASSTLAQTVTGNLAITANVVKVCSVGTGATLAFGNYDPNSATALDANTTFTVTCTKGTTFTVALDQGTHALAGARRMAGGTDFLSYELYTTAAHTTVWNTTNTVAGTAASRLPTTLTVYGQIPINQDVIAATFTDTVVITVTY